MSDRNITSRNAVKRLIFDRILQRILEGILLRISASNFWEQICKEYKDALEAVELKLSLNIFCGWLDEIWKKQGTEKDLIMILKERVPNPAEEFHRLNPHIPLDLIKEWVRRLRGVISAPRKPKFVRGVLNIEFPEDMKIREPSAYGFSKPFEISTSPHFPGKCVIANGTNLGILHTPIIAENIVRLAFSLAHRIKSRGLFLTGGMFALDVKRAGGPLKALRALSLGRNVNINIFESSYQEKALHILKEQPVDAVVYESLSEAFSNLISGWYKASHCPADSKKNGEDKNKPVKEKPEYRGPVYVILGRSEEDIIVAMAYWKLRYITVVEQSKLTARIRAANNAVTNRIKQLDKELEKPLRDRNQEYVVRLSEMIAEAERSRDDLIGENSKTRVTNISVEDFHRFIRLAYSYVAEEIEKAIPNCVVIGSSSQVCLLDGKTVEFHVPSDDHVTAHLLGTYAKTSGPKIVRQTMADHVIICQPHALYPNGTVREVDQNGVRGYARVSVAPTLVDSSYYRQRTNFIVRKNAHPISKNIYDDRHIAGVLLLDVENGMVQTDFVSADVLFKQEGMEKNGNGNKHRRHVIPAPRYMWGMIATDQHWGGPSKCFVTKPNADGIRQRFGMNEAVFEMLRNAGLCTPEQMPIHFWWAMDDLTQGCHFENYKQPHHHLIPYYVMEELFTEAYNQATSLKKARSQIQKTADIVLYQMEKSGPVWTHDQMETVIQRHLKSHVDAFSAILGSADRAGIQVNGISHYARIAEHAVVADSRDVGLLVHGTGNHFLNSVKKEIMEGPLYSSNLRALLAAQPHWAGREQYLEKHVCSPRYGNQMIAYGTYRVEDEYEYAIELRDTPTRMSGWGDTLLAHITNDMQRGNYARFLNDKLKITAIGDKHFFTYARVPWGFFLMGPASTETDVYGERGFPPNNTGVVLLGLPEKGPHYAPILVRPLLYPDIRRFIETGENIDWNVFLSNPV
jgi:hypothetical protein